MAVLLLPSFVAAPTSASSAALASGMNPSAPAPPIAERAPLLTPSPHAPKMPRGTSIEVLAQTRIPRFPATAAPRLSADVPTGFRARPSTLSVGTGFAGLNDSQCSCAPPDVIDAVGPSQVVEMVNLYVEVWNKQGVAKGGTGLSSFFSAGTDFLSDPKVVYDNQSGRWFASVLDGGASGTGLVRLAVSSGNDALGTWTVYTNLVAPSGDFADQPILGVSDHVVALAGNIFSESTSNFFGSEVWIVQKSALLNASTASVQTWGPNGNFLSIHPVESLGSAPVQYLVSSSYTLSNAVALFTVSGVPPSASISVANVSVNAYTNAPGAREPGGSLIDPADTRVESAVVQNGALWLTFEDQCFPSGDGTARACARLVEIVSGSAQQDFDYGLKGLDVYYPALTLDSVGDLGLGFGYSSTTVDPSFAVTGRAPTDPSGTLQPYATVVAGTADATCTGGCRYGDYFGAATDPGSPTMWVAGEFLDGGHAWDSWLAPLRVFGSTAAVTTALPTGADVGQSVFVTVTIRNSTCTTGAGLLCSLLLPFGDGATASVACVASLTTYVTPHAFLTAGRYAVGAGGYLAVYSGGACIPGNEVANLSLTPYSLTIASDPSLFLLASPTRAGDVGEPLSFHAVVEGGQSPDTYAWRSLPAGCAGGTGAFANCTATTAGSFTVSVMLTDANGWEQNASLFFTVAANITAALASDHSFADVGQTIRLSVSPAGGSGAYAIGWSGLPSGCAGLNETTLACAPTTVGDFTVVAYANDSNGWSVRSNAVQIVVRSALVVTLAAPDTARGAPVTLTVQVNGGTAPYSYAWRGLPVGCAGRDGPQLNCTPTSTGAFALVVTVTDSAGNTVNASASWNVSGSSPSPGVFGLGGGTMLWVVLLAVIVLAAIATAVILMRRRPREPVPPREEAPR
jgi:hypothetical protein